MSLSYLPRPLPSLLSSPFLVRGFKRHQMGSKVLYGWGAQGSLCRRDRTSSSSAFPAFHRGESRRRPACAPDAPRTQTEAEEGAEKRWGEVGREEVRQEEEEEGCFLWLLIVFDPSIEKHHFRQGWNHENNFKQNVVSGLKGESKRPVF